MTRSWVAVLALLALTLSITPAAPAGAQATSSGWSVQPSPDAPGAKYNELDAVACPGPASCYAVGFSYVHTAGHTLPLAERWNGTGWAIQPIPTLRTAGRTFLNGISCAAANRCIAVGFAVTTNAPYIQALAEAWNGIRWAIRPPSQPGSGGAEFDGVSCTATAACMAVGGFAKGPSGVYQPLAEQWNGTAWTMVPVPNPHADNGSFLSAVSCTAARACMADGDFDYADIAQSVFAMRWNGTTWARQQQLNPGSQRQDADNAVSCTTSTACTSVGYWVGFSGQGPLAEAGNGSTWAREQVTPPRGNRLATLNGVSCASLVSCIAVGDWSPSAGGGTPAYGVAALWNGTAWALQRPPTPAGSDFASLNGVACVSADQCFAVGTYAGKTAGLTLIERYSG